MKKLIWAIALFSIFAGVFYSCNKSDEIVTDYDTNNNIEQSTDNLVVLQAGDSNNPKWPNWGLRVFYCEWNWIWENGHLTWGIVYCNCFGVFGNCLNTVTITAKNEAYDTFKDYYDKNSMPKYFATDNYKDLFSKLEEMEVLDDLRSGDIKLHLYYDKEMGKEFYIALPKEVEFSTSDTSWMSKTELVLPFLIKQ